MVLDIGPLMHITPFEQPWLIAYAYISQVEPVVPVTVEDEITETELDDSEQSEQGTESWGQT